MVLDHGVLLPRFARITAAQRNDIPTGRQFWSPPDSRWW